MVLRVSAMRAPVCATSATYRAVRVAIPDIRCTKFRPTRSAVSTARAGPVTTASVRRAANASPSA